MTQDTSLWRSRIKVADHRQSAYSHSFGFNWIVFIVMQCQLLIVLALVTLLQDSRLVSVRYIYLTYHGSRSTLTESVLSHRYHLLREVCKTPIPFLLFLIQLSFQELLNLVFSTHSIFEITVSVGLLDMVSLSAVMYIEVRPFTSGSLQTPHNWDPHWQQQLLYVSIVINVIGSVNESSNYEP